MYSRFAPFLVATLVSAASFLAIDPVCGEGGETDLESVDAEGERWPSADVSLSLAQVSRTAGSTEQTLEPIVVRGFDVEPPDYPALPPVEGTKINSGKKTSFARPDALPQIVRLEEAQVERMPPV